MSTQFRNYGEDISSAKGATFISQPGATPQGRRNCKFPALKARFMFGQYGTVNPFVLNRAFSACLLRNRIPGALPQAGSDIAPVPLKK